MLDQCTIAINAANPVFLDPEVIHNDGFLLHGLLSLEDVASAKPKRRQNHSFIRQKKHFISVLPNGALTVTVVEEPPLNIGQPPRYRITRIDFNAPKLLYAHNGASLQSDRHLCLSLSVLLHLLEGLLEHPRQAILLIPGLSKISKSFWGKLEIAMNLSDPDGAVLRGMTFMTTSLIRLKPLNVRSETITLKGEHLKLNVYRKHLQMQKMHSSRTIEFAEPLTRLEVTLYLRKFPDAFDFLDVPARPRTEMIDGKRRLVWFNLNHLVAAHRHYFTGLRGVYQSKVPPKSTREFKLAATLANIARQFDLPAGDLLDIYFKTVDCKPATKTDLRKQVATRLEEGSAMKSEELLSDEHYRNQPAVAVPNLTGHIRHLDVHDPHPDIQRVYGAPVDPELAKAGLFDPQTTEF